MKGGKEKIPENGKKGPGERGRLREKVEKAGKKAEIKAGDEARKMSTRIDEGQTDFGNVLKVRNKGDQQRVL